MLAQLHCGQTAAAKTWAAPGGARLPQKGAFLQGVRGRGLGGALPGSRPPRRLQGRASPVGHRMVDVVDNGWFQRLWPWAKISPGDPGREIG